MALRRLPAISIARAGPEWAAYGLSRQPAPL